MLKRELFRRRHPIDTIPFEAFYHGSWHEVDHVSIKDGSIYIQFNDHGSETQERIHPYNLRLRSRKASIVDCLHFLRADIDVCVLAAHPNAESSDQELQPVWNDAKIISIKRTHHEGRCACLFSVIFRKSEAPTSMKNNTFERRAVVVTIDSIAILQKLQREPCEDGYYQWSSSEDCIYNNKCRLLSGTFFSEVSWLVVMSTLKRMEFEIKLMQNKILYHILNSGQGPSNIADVESVRDPDRFSSNSDKNVPVIRFQNLNETLRPKIGTLVLGVPKEITIPDSTSDVDPVDSMLENELDYELLYEFLDLRCSKRRKLLPDRFVSYDMPNFNRCSIRHVTHEMNGVEQETQTINSATCISMPTMSSSLPAKEELHAHKLKHVNVADSLVEIQGNLEKSISRVSSKYGETSRSAAVVRRKNILERKDPELLSRHPIVLDVEDICYQQKVSSQSECKRYSNRKKLLSVPECKQMIERCMENIKSEMEKELQPVVLQCAPNLSKTFPEATQDFNWSPTIDAQIEHEEHADMWKEMEDSLTTLALLEQKEQLSTEFSNGTTDISNKDEEQPCPHDFKLDEEIGMICRLCHFICTEIRYISAPFLRTDGWVTCKEQSNAEIPCWMRPYDFDSDPSSNDVSSKGISLSEGYDNVWNLIPDLRARLHLHQKKAFEFIWGNIAGSLKPKEMTCVSESTGGCVISHSPGSGKTLLLISFIVSYLRLFPRRRPLILAPKTAIYTWCKEFEKWEVSIPVYQIHPFESYKREMLNWRTGMPSADGRKPNRAMMHVMDCLTKLGKWHEHPSVLLMSYSSFLSLAQDSKLEHRRFMAGVLQRSPGILILDEGHNPRSTKSKLRKLLMKVNTEFRILLSGTLFQNTFKEYFNTLCLARPRFIRDAARVLDPRLVNQSSSKKRKWKKKNLREKFARKLFVEEIGLRIESSEEDDRRKGFDILNKITNGFIDVYEGENLDTLPGLHIYTLLLTSTDVQQEVLVKLQKSIKHKRCPLELELLITVGSIHPWLIKTVASVDNYFNADELEKIDRYKGNFKSGSKVKLVIDLVHRSTIRGERVLIFCRNIAPINLLVDLFETIFGWRKDEEVLSLQGDQELFVRGQIIEKFNGDAKGKCRVLLASTTACAEGISLTAASRVVLLDSEWNHAKTRQAIARAFRPGQERVVYVYRLLASGTWEEDKYDSNEWKAWLSKMIFVGRYIKYSSSRQVENIDDEMLRELVEEDNMKTVQMIMKHD